jgi:glutathione S-transferase
MHPLSSYCHKALIAFYENKIPFEAKVLDNATVFGEFKKLWPIGRFPVLRDDGRDTTVAESSIIIEYLALHYPGSVKLLPDDPDLAWRVRMRDRFFDNYLHTPLQKFPADRQRPQDKRDPVGVDEARAMYRTALDMLDAQMSHNRWAMTSPWLTVRPRPRSSSATGSSGRFATAIAARWPISTASWRAPRTRAPCRRRSRTCT